MRKKLFDTPILAGRHPNFSGLQRIYRFENGYGASVVRFWLDDTKDFFSHTENDSQWELAVIKFHGDNPHDFKICYDTPITEDVIGYLEEDDVEKLLNKISRLKDIEKGRKN